MNLTQYLKQNRVAFELHKHRPTFTAQQMAAVEHIPGMNVAKPVVVKADGEYYMCVLPACYKIDLELLRRQLGAEEIRLVEENDLANIFPDCELGAEPPFGMMFGLTTILEQSLESKHFIVCQTGKHDESVRLTMKDFQRLEKPKVIPFGFHLH